MFKRLAFLLVLNLCIIPMSLADAQSPIVKRDVAMEGHAMGYLGMFLTHFKIMPNPPRSYEKSDFSLLVINSYKVNEQISEVPAKDPGIIMVVATKDGQSIEEYAKFKGNGIYVGHLTFPEAGSWHISIKGTRINHDGSVSNAEADSTVEVVVGEKQLNEKNDLIYWVIAIMVTLFILFVIWKIHICRMIFDANS